MWQSTIIEVFPLLHDIPIFGHQAKSWLWTLDLSPGFFGQGMIMGPYISIHMLMGAIVGWAILSPLAQHKGWAPGPVDDWSDGSRGWIIWISLASLLADSSIKLSWVIFRSMRNELGFLRYFMGTLGDLWSNRVRPVLFRNRDRDYVPLQTEPPSEPASARTSIESSPANSLASPHDLSGRHHMNTVSVRVLTLGFLLSFALCIVTTRYVFGQWIPWHFIPLAIALSLPMAVVGIRSLAETDYNPGSAIGKSRYCLTSVTNEGAKYPSWYLPCLYRM